MPATDFQLLVSRREKTGVLTIYCPSPASIRATLLPLRWPNTRATTQAWTTVLPNTPQMSPSGFFVGQNICIFFQDLPFKCIYEWQKNTSLMPRPRDETICFGLHSPLSNTFTLTSLCTLGRGKSEKKECLNKRLFTSIAKKSCVYPKSCLFIYL